MMVVAILNPQGKSQMLGMKSTRDEVFKVNQFYNHIRWRGNKLNFGRGKSLIIKKIKKLTKPFLKSESSDSTEDINKHYQRTKKNINSDNSIAKVFEKCDDMLIKHNNQSKSIFLF